MARLSKFARLRRIEDFLRGYRALARPYAMKVWRPLFLRTEFIGITGSHGKTTASLLLADMLRTVASTACSAGNNQPTEVLRNVMKGRPWRHRYLVQELSGHYPGAIADSVATLRPRIGIVTGVGGDHRKQFGGSLDAIAAEKGSLVHLLPPDGLAVLNADDSRVGAMAAGAPCRVVRFGAAGGADLRLISARSRWPERLVLEVEYKGERFEVKTQLVGTHWAVSVMAALLTALELGVPRADCLKAAEAMQPAVNRMSVHPSPHGGWYVLDAVKASFFGIENCLGFLKDADAAPRRTVLFGTIADYPGATRPHYSRVARMALDVADRVIFTGRNAQSVRRLVAGEFAGRLFAAEDYSEAIRLIESDPVPGEIVYVKSSRVDQLGSLLVPHIKARVRMNRSVYARPPAK
jgi:UDP-N-acetylmuramoyl-tripeptide--D-alanyl-D-alanine ligase